MVIVDGVGREGWIEETAAAAVVVVVVVVVAAAEEDAKLLMGRVMSVERESSITLPEPPKYF